MTRRPVRDQLDFLEVLGEALTPSLSGREREDGAGASALSVFSIGPGRPFLDVLARWWLAGSGDEAQGAADGLILLPTRRAARALSEAFLRVSGGAPLLLPRIAALGALDEAPLALAGALELAPAVEPEMRLAVLARMVLALNGSGGAPRTADGAWRLARELASLLDDAYRSDVQLPVRLPEAAEEGFAEHWQRVIRFLTVVTTHWPVWLADNGRMDAAQRALQLLEVQATVWETAPPPYRVVVAGTTGGVASVARLMRVVAGLPGGSVILPGLDLAMDEHVWEALEDGHPQAGMRGLLARMGVDRAEVRELEPETEQSGRAEMVRIALLPASGLSRWRERVEPALDGLAKLEPADQQEEAVAIALALRGALERKGAQAALVTPDRGLALRVSAELTRFGIIVDDSAGEALGQTPPASFLRLIARAVADGLSPVSLLAVLKHPLAGFGLPTVACRRLARRLERRCLRGPAPPPGVAGLRQAIHSLSLRERVGVRAGGSEGVEGGLLDLIDRIEARLRPVLSLPEVVAPSAALAALIEAAELAAATDAETGATRLWALEEGEALATHLAGLARAMPVLPEQGLAVLPGLLDAALEGSVVRSRRALRGRAGAEHPRVQILGLLEARLQSFDLLVLGGLTEGVWPAATDPGPWMSRPMRRQVGLESPEERVGQMAHDFASLACAAPTVILSSPRRRDGAPAVPSRWLVRLDAYLRGQDADLPHHPAARWARLLDQPDGAPLPVSPPAPRPPTAVRPRRLSVTEIETWLRDPYAIYAKHVLGIRALDPLEQTADAADYGTVVHKAVAEFVAALGAPFPPDAARRLRAAMDRALEERALRPALAAWWRPRLHRIADWLAEREAERRAERVPVEVGCERKGEWGVPEGVGFTLSGIADRIERHADGSLSILDYKTGTLPRGTDVDGGYAAQLPLEAAMAEAGAFGPELAGEVAELAYWRLTGGMPPGVIKPLPGKTPVPERVRESVDSLVKLILDFDDPGRAYLSQPHPGAVPRFSDYAQLARVAEWAVLEEGE